MHIHLYTYVCLCVYIYIYVASQVALVVKNPPANPGDVRDMGSISESEEPLEEGMATHFSILAWRISWTKEPGELQSTDRKESDMTEAA